MFTYPKTHPRPGSARVVDKRTPMIIVALAELVQAATIVSFYCLVLPVAPLWVSLSIGGLTASWGIIRYRLFRRHPLPRTVAPRRMYELSNLTFVSTPRTQQLLTTVTIGAIRATMLLTATFIAACVRWLQLQGPLEDLLLGWALITSVLTFGGTLGGARSVVVDGNDLVVQHLGGWKRYRIDETVATQTYGTITYRAHITDGWKQSELFFSDLDVQLRPFDPVPIGGSR